MKLNLVKAYVILQLLLVCVSLPMRSQMGAPLIQNFPQKAYHSEEYASSPQNTYIFQSNLGQVFAANRDVSLCYDGRSWEGIEGTQFNNLGKFAMDPEGRIYAGGAGELGCFKADSSGRLRFTSLKAGLPKELLPLGFIFATATDLLGNVYFLEKQWLIRYDGKKFTVWKAPTAFRKIFLVNGKIVVQCLNAGLHTLEGGQLVPILNSNTVDGLMIKGLYQMDATSMLIITFDRGLYTFDGEALTHHPSAIDSVVVWNTVALGNGEIALATESTGLVVYKTADNSVWKIDEKRGLYSNSLSVANHGTEGGIWVSSDHGISRIAYPTALRRVVTDERRNFTALSIAQIEQGLLVGSVDGCWLYRFGADGDHVERLEGSIDVVRSLVPYKDWVLAGLTGLGVFGWREGIFRQITSKAANTILISKSRPTVIYLGMEAGLSTLTMKGENWEEGPMIPGLSHRIYDLAETPNGDIWAAFSEVSRVQYPNGYDAPPVVTTFDSTQGFAADHGDYDLWVFEGKLYFGTSRGLFHFDEQRQQLVPDSTFGARFADQGNAAHYMTQDYQGNIWLYDGTHTGVLRQDANCKWQWDDLPLRRMDDQVVWCIYPAPDSLIWIGTTSTLYCYDPRIPKDYREPYRTLIDRVTVNDTDIVFYGHYADSAGLFVDWQPDNYKLTFPYTQNGFAFSFAATSYEDPEKLLFSYWLEGYEETWSPWIKESDKAYNNLPEGRYTFRVRSKNLYDTLGKEAAYTFTILPPWQRTWWAYMIYAVAGIGIMVLIVRWQVGRANRRQEALRAQERAQQRAMLQATVDAQENERTRIAKDLHDDIQVTLSTAKLKLGMLNRSMKKQGLASDETAESVDLIQDAIQSVREISQDLLPAALDRLGLAQALKELCEKVDSGERLQVTFGCSGTERRIAKDIELTIYRVAQELFANALKHAKADRVQVALSFGADGITLEMEDNGKGFELAAVEAQGKGLGFKNMQSRISLVSGKFTYASVLGQGSRFRVEVPL